MRICKSLALVVLVSSFLLAIVSCSKGPLRIYKHDIQQGNYVTQEMVDQLRVGLTKREVQQIMGSSTFIPVFEQNIWYYDYSLLPGNGKAPIKTNLALYFKGDYLQSYSGDWNIPSLPKR